MATKTADPTRIPLPWPGPNGETDTELPWTDATPKLKPFCPRCGVTYVHNDRDAHPIRDPRTGETVCHWCATNSDAGPVKSLHGASTYDPADPWGDIC